MTVYPHPSTPADYRPPPVSGAWADRLAGTVYVVVAVVALAGQSTAAVHWLGWPLLPALGAVGVVELTAVALAARADYRRRLGESAVAASVLSGVVAAFMTGVNWAGHWQLGQQVAAWFFAATTAVGYLVWLLHSAARRRDQLRAQGRLRDTGPEYGWWQWARHPVITRRAQALALRHPDLGLYGSLDRAADDQRRERRNRALSRALRRQVRRAAGRNRARIAELTYDMNEIAARLAAGADYDGLTALVAAGLKPERLAAASGDRPAGATTPATTGPEPEPTTPPPAEATTDGDQDAQVLPYRQASTRRRTQPTTRRATTPSTPTVDELVDTLCREHCTPDHPATIGRPTALKTLRRVYGRCAVQRAGAAKDAHADRHATTGDQPGDGDDQESEAAAWAG